MSSTPPPAAAPVAGSDRLFGLLLGAFAVSFAVEMTAAVRHLQSGWGDLVFWLLASALLWLVWRERAGAGRAWLCAAWVIGVATLVEMPVAARTFLFGPFVYSDLSRPSVAALPVAVPLSWWVIVGGAYLAVERLWGEWRAGVSALTALVAVELAMLIMPVAVLVRHEREWLNIGGYYGIPWEYFAGFFILALGLTLGLVFLGDNRSDAESRQHRQTWVPSAVLLAVVCLFGAAALREGLWLAAGFGAINAVLTVSVLADYLRRRGRPA